MPVVERILGTAGTLYRVRGVRRPAGQTILQALLSRIPRAMVKKPGKGRKLSTGEILLLYPGGPVRRAARDPERE